jgi:hypothetical protein
VLGTSRKKQNVPFFGSKIEEYNPSKYKMWFVHNWRESLDAWHDDIAKIVGKK